MTALSIVQEAAGWLGLPIPVALFIATDTQTVQLRELLCEEIKELTAWPDKAWPEITKERIFATVAAEVQPGAMPPDLGRFIDGSIWDRTTRRPVYGPLTPQQWQQEVASVAAGTRRLMAEAVGKIELYVLDGKEPRPRELERWRAQVIAKHLPTKGSA